MNGTPRLSSAQFGPDPDPATVANGVAAMVMLLHLRPAGTVMP